MADAPASTWSTQQLAEFLVAVAACEDRDAAIVCAVQSAAEALEAEVGVAISRDTVIESIGFPRERVPVAELLDVVRGETSALAAGPGKVLHAVAVPVEDLDGSLLLARSGAEAFQPEELALLRAMARSLSMTLRILRMLESERGLREEGERREQENMRLLVMLQERQTLFERLSKIQASISRRAPLPEVLDAIVHGAHELLGDEVVALRLLDRDNPEYIQIVSSIGVSRAMLAAMRRTPVTDGAGGRAIVEDRLVTIEEYQEDEGGIDEFKGARLQCAMAAPVHEDGKPIGSIVVASYRRNRTYSPTEREMLLAFAHHASIALNDAKAMDQMRHMAYHDPLTGLPNRALFAEHLHRAVANAARSGASLAVLFLDLDRFKLVNDSLGHGTGDRLLECVASRLRGSLRSADLAARLGGDEFAVLAENTSATGASALAQALVNALRDPFIVDDHELAVTASVGVAVDSAGRTSAEALLRNADLAMYRAKLEGPGHHLVYEPAMHALVSERATLEGNLRRAVVTEDFVVHYQPIVKLHNGEPVGVEALVRWRSDDGTLVPPAAFIPVAEDMGLIVPIGRIVMREAMRQTREWQRAIPSAADLGVAINLSARQLYQPDVVEDIVEAMRESGLAPASLTVEITETALMHDTTVVSGRLTELRALGVRIALDDFGTGYSSLSYLRNFPIDVVKVDKSFINDVADGSENASVTRAIIELGRTLQLQTVAEGVEEPEQVAALLRLDCQVAQGYFFSRPLPARELAAYLRAHSPEASAALAG